MRVHSHRSNTQRPHAPTQKPHDKQLHFIVTCMQSHEHKATTTQPLTAQVACQRRSANGHTNHHNLEWTIKASTRVHTAQPPSNTKAPHPNSSCDARSTSNYWNTKTGHHATGTSQNHAPVTHASNMRLSLNFRLNIWLECFQ